MAAVTQFDLEAFRESILSPGANPYGVLADEFRANGYNGVFPLKPRSKNPLGIDPGYHGHGGHGSILTEAADRAAKMSPHNIAARAIGPDWYLARIDVDSGPKKNRKGEIVVKDGGPDFDRAVAERGEIRRTVIQTSGDPLVLQGVIVRRYVVSAGNGLIAGRGDRTDPRLAPAVGRGHLVGPRRCRPAVRRLPNQ